LARHDNEHAEARMANTKLVYVDDDLPGLLRRKAGRGWAYYDAHGTRITDRDEIDRLNAIGMPPAYKDCWFCPSPHGHIQAIGYDDRGRKQYRSHLDLGHVRVGNDAYQRDNGSFGATTLRNRHAKVTGSRLKLCYLGKSGKTQTLTIEDRRLSAVVKRVQDLPGQRLFQYLDDAGERHNVTSGDVNDYLREASGGPFTAKHFRTWGASVIAYRTIVEAGADGIGLKAVLAPVAEALGNTPAISRKSYVHPALIELAKAGGMKGEAPVRLPRATRWLAPAERGLIAFLDALVQVPATQAA
jgi:DNA topoisomerase-1